MQLLATLLSLVAAGASAVSAQNTATGKLGDAVAVTNNPAGKTFVATLPDDPFWTAGSLKGNVKGSLTAVSGANGAGVDFQATFSNLPTEGGPFTFHLHVDPVNNEGNCTATLAHLDPFVRGEDPPCDPSSPKTCQVGDLSGKYGKIMSDPYTIKFHDDFTSMQEGPGSYFLNRSLVVHFANKTRITCANFSPLQGNGTVTPTSATATPTTTATAAPTAGAMVVKATGGLSLLCLTVMLFCL
ncbi:superoxide dismutase [Xylariaceae sp. FL1272]|nr:superoxide dismutase [Xylariaceae sp. FL1272]